ncbi:MAG TPA: MTH1187 family thiamine-binding protein [Candidatus Krumholzibacterium sp.]|nr:MTH1187 family thiamine-binding protein [Candidatus Krumholzibacterium sp.]
MLASFTVVPVDAGESLSGHIARIIDLVDRSGLEYRMGPMETTVEGEYDEVMDLVKRCHMEMRSVAKRVVTTIKIDDREGAEGRITGKVASVEEKLGRKVRR